MRAGCGAWQDHELEWVRGPPVLPNTGAAKPWFLQGLKGFSDAQGIARMLCFTRFSAIPVRNVYCDTPDYHASADMKAFVLR